MRYNIWNDLKLNQLALIICVFGTVGLILFFWFLYRWTGDFDWTYFIALVLAPIFITSFLIYLEVRRKDAKSKKEE